MLNTAAARTLPSSVTLGDLSPAAGVDPIPVGADGHGRPYAAASPTIQVGGATGTGKTQYLRTEAIQRLRRGHHVIVVDLAACGKNYADIEPHMLALARTVGEGVAALEWVYDEAERRRGAGDDGMYPLTVIVDGLVYSDDDTLRFHQSLPGRLQDLVRRLAAHHTSRGVHVIAAAQRPHKKLLKGIEAPVTTIVTFDAFNLGPLDTILRCVLPAAEARRAAAAVQVMPVRRGPGLAVAVEGHSAIGVRVATARGVDVPALLDREVGRVHTEHRIDLTDLPPFSRFYRIPNRRTP